MLGNFSVSRPCVFLDLDLFGVRQHTWPVKNGKKVELVRELSNRGTKEVLRLD